jgi:hypothetical protein
MRQKIECADFALELRSSIAGSRRRRDLREGRRFFGHIEMVLEIWALHNPTRGVKADKCLIPCNISPAK